VVYSIYDDFHIVDTVTETSLAHINNCESVPRRNGRRGNYAADTRGI